MKMRDLLRLDLGALFRGKVEVTPPSVLKRWTFRSLRLRFGPLWIAILVLACLAFPILVLYLLVTRLIFPRRRLHLITVSDQLSRIIACNAPLVPALEAVAVDAPNQVVLVALTRLNESLSQGLSLADAMLRQPRFFPKFYVDLVRVGENSGTLPAVFEQLVTMLSEYQRVRTAVQRSLAYLLFLLTISTLLTAFLALKVFPVLQGVIKDFRGHLYGDILPVRVFDWVVYHFLRWRGFLSPLESVVVWVIVALMLLYVVLRTDLPRRFIRRVALAFPLFRQLVIQSNLAHISQVLSRLLQAGYPVDEALVTASNADIMPMFAKLLRRMRQRVAQGETLANAAGAERLIPVAYHGMLSIGESSGTLPDSLDYLGDFYQKKVLRNSIIIMRIVFPITIILAGCWVFMVYSYPFIAIVQISDSIIGSM